MIGSRVLGAMVMTLLLAGCNTIGPQAVGEAQKAPAYVDFALRHNIGEDGKREPMDTKETKAWRETDFSGKGKVYVKNGVVYLEQGNDLTGINWAGQLVRMDYEITLEAMRVAGDDFFCGLTFPYGPDPCSLIVGGWGGTCVGLSSLDYYDAYNNETARFMEFEKNRWYRIRLRVTKTNIQAWIDERKIVDVETKGRTIGIRWEMEPSKPLGIASWRTTAALRKVRLHAFTESEKMTE